jgi:hypothetical protein
MTRFVLSGGACFLAEREYTLEDLRRKVKGTVRQIASDVGGLISDHTNHKKAWTDEKELICWDFDHVVGCTTKGIDLINVLYCI